MADTNYAGKSLLQNAPDYDRMIDRMFGDEELRRKEQVAAHYAGLTGGIFLNAEQLLAVREVVASVYALNELIALTQKPLDAILMKGSVLTHLLESAHKLQQTNSTI